MKKYIFELYLSSLNANNQEIALTVKRVLKKEFKYDFEFKIYDLFKKTDEININIYATPLLLRVKPKPVLEQILSNKQEKNINNILELLKQ